RYGAARAIRAHAELVGAGRAGSPAGPGRRAGWHRMWEPSCHVQTEPPGWSLHLSLNFKGLPAMRLATVRPEFVCEVRDPSGARHKTRPGSVYGGGSLVSCSYPRDFDGAPSPRPGVYTVVWKER